MEAFMKHSQFKRGLSMLGAFLMLGAMIVPAKSQAQTDRAAYYCRALDQLNHVLYFSSVFDDGSTGDPTGYEIDMRFSFSDYVRNRLGGNLSGAGGTLCFRKSSFGVATDAEIENIRRMGGNPYRVVTLSWTYKP
jgi:hypothetical protein